MNGSNLKSLNLKLFFHISERTSINDFERFCGHPLDHWFIQGRSAERAHLMGSFGR